MSENGKRSDIGAVGENPNQITNHSDKFIHILLILMERMMPMVVTFRTFLPSAKEHPHRF